MTVHFWGDEGVDWAGIDAAAEYIGRGLRRWGRLSVTTWKEKFGQVRVHTWFGISELEFLIWPGYTWCHAPLWWRWVDWRLLGWLRFAINLGLVPYQQWLYRLYYRRAVRKWPHLRNEIIEGADWPELLDGMSKKRANASNNRAEFAGRAD